jgi:SAM-dependent methyltransferase
MDYLKINKTAWDKRTKIHLSSEFYNLKGFLKGENILKEIELAELNNIEDKSLLHLQCHFGLDTLSWARLGASVTGVDLSPVAIDQANEIKQKVNLDAQFICSDIYQFGEKNTKQYDIVFTSYGALCWLPSLAKWAETVVSSLKLGGRFYIVEFHPIYDLVSGYTYFHQDEPDIEEEGTYTENNNGETTTLATWGHPLSDVINALIRVGIQIDHVNEFPFSPHNCFDGLEQREKGRYYMTDSQHDIPLVYSILGTKNI